MATPVIAHHLEVVNSTQDEARTRFTGRPLLVTAEFQRAGRGRSGADWLTAPRAVAASLAWQPSWPASSRSRLALVAGLAACDALGAPLSLKWPNDLLSGEEKVGGILAEMSDDLVVIGLGVNLYWPEPPAGVAALHRIDPGVDAARAAAMTWAERLLLRAVTGPEDWGRQDYLSLCATLGREVTWEPDGLGVARDVAEDGRLVVETASGEVRLDSGAVRHVRAVGGGGSPHG